MTIVKHKDNRRKRWPERKYCLTCRAVKKYAYIFLLMLCALAAVSCSRDGMRTDEDGPYSDVFIYCALGYNNLNGYLLDNLEDMKGGVLPERARDKAVVAYCHNTLRGGGYDTPNPPVLLRLYRDKGRVHADTLKVYSERAVGAWLQSGRRESVREDAG